MLWRKGRQKSKYRRWVYKDIVTFDSTTTNSEPIFEMQYHLDEHTTRQ